MKRVIRKLFHAFDFVLNMSLFFLSFPIAFLLFKGKRIWLISEVDFDARDNGLHFFKYLNQYHPEINSVYLISKKNPFFNSISEIGKTCEPHSYRHMLIFIAAQFKISTLVHGCSPSWCVTKFLLKHHGPGKNIALKHGIFKNLHPNYFKKNAHLDMICCGGKDEFEFIDKNFEYEPGIAKYTGLARFDALHNLDLRNEIFIMPTWRRWLDNISSEEEFSKSLYYKMWHSFISDDRLNKICFKNKMEICFYIHPKLNRFTSLLNKEGSNIKFLSSKAGDSVQEHLKKAAVMITDFSSVFFDFAYMRKPAIYYQFDEEEYYKSHYIKGYFDYRENGFGPVVTEKDQLVEEIEKIIRNNNQMEKLFLDRANSFFVLSDSNNCERIFNGIIEVAKR